MRQMIYPMEGFRGVMGSCHSRAKVSRLTWAPPRGASLDTSAQAVQGSASIAFQELTREILLGERATSSVFFISRAGCKAGLHQQVTNNPSQDLRKAAQGTCVLITVLLASFFKYLARSRSASIRSCSIASM